MADAELRAAITAVLFAKLENEGRIHRCGDCGKWMTRGCPQEQLGNDGRNRGPSCKALPCPEFRAASSVASSVMGGGDAS